VSGTLPMPQDTRLSRGSPSTVTPQPCVRAQGAPGIGASQRRARTVAASRAVRCSRCSVRRRCGRRAGRGRGRSRGRGGRARRGCAGSSARRWQIARREALALAAGLRGEARAVRGAGDQVGERGDAERRSRTRWQALELVPVAAAPLPASRIGLEVRERGAQMRQHRRLGVRVEDQHQRLRVERPAQRRVERPAQRRVELVDAAAGDVEAGERGELLVAAVVEELAEGVAAAVLLGRSSAGITRTSSGLNGAVPGAQAGLGSSGCAGPGPVSGQVSCCGPNARDSHIGSAVKPAPMVTVPRNFRRCMPSSVKRRDSGVATKFRGRRRECEVGSAERRGDACVRACARARARLSRGTRGSGSG
jgi:hypothetical protein